MLIGSKSLYLRCASVSRVARSRALDSCPHALLRPSGSSCARTRRLVGCADQPQRCFDKSERCSTRRPAAIVGKDLVLFRHDHAHRVAATRPRPWCCVSGPAGGPATARRGSSVAISAWSLMVCVRGRRTHRLPPSTGLAAPDSAAHARGRFSHALCTHPPPLWPVGTPVCRVAAGRRGALPAAIARLNPTRRFGH